MSLIPGLDTLKCLGVALMVSGAASVASGITYYAKGKKADKQRSDLVISKMVTQYQQDLLDANARADTIAEAWRAQRQGAQRAYDQLEAQRRNDVDSVRIAAGRDADILRQRIAEIARGGQAASAPGAPNGGGAETLGLVLERALRNAESATAAAEGNADAYRSLRQAWPVTPAEAP